MRHVVFERVSSCGTLFSSWFASFLPLSAPAAEENR